MARPGGGRSRARWRCSTGCATACGGDDERLGALPGPAARPGRRRRPGRRGPARGWSCPATTSGRPRSTTWATGHRWPSGWPGTGTSADVARRSVAVVGARACTPYGEHVAAELAAGLGDRGWTVVSGGAYGIDAAAHRGALAVDGPTVAVLACGVDVRLPGGARRPAALGPRRAAPWCPSCRPARRPTRRRFLDRNRVIAALGRGTVVVEAAIRSGALNTAGHAEELSRTVMAVPGPVTSAASAGCHELLRTRGAALVTDAADVLDLVGDLVRRRQRPATRRAAAARRARPGGPAGARGAAGAPPGAGRQRRPGRRPGRADRAARAGAAGGGRAGRAHGRAGGAAGRPAAARGRRRPAGARPTTPSPQVGPARRCLRCATTSGHGVVRGRRGGTAGRRSPSAPSRAAAGARRRAGGASPGTCAPSADLSEHTVRAYRGDVATPARARPPDGPGQPGRARPARAAQLAGRPGDPGDGPHHAGPPGRGRPRVHRLGGPRAGCSPPTRARCWPRRAPAARCPACCARTRRRAAGRRRAGGRRRQPRRRSATWRCSRCSTPPASGSASCAGSTSTTSTGPAGCCGCSARAPRSGRCRSALPALRAVERWLAAGPAAAARAGQRRGAVPRVPGRPARPADGAAGRARAAGARARGS